MKSQATKGGAEALQRRIAAEYQEMPGLKLTAAQASRLLALELPVCHRILQELVDRQFLRRTNDGAFVRY